LTCAHLVIGEELADHLDLPMVDDLRRWSELLAVDTMLEYEDGANWYKAIKYLLTSRVEAWRGGQRHTVGQLLDDLAADWEADPNRTPPAGASWLTLPDARRFLAQAGLGLLRPGELDGGHVDPGGWVLAVPNESQLVADLYKATPWAGSGGSASVWKSALRQAPPEIICIDPSKNRIRINGVRERCTLVRLKAFNEWAGKSD
jgi:hypothetical protein